MLPFGRIDLNGRINRRESNTIETYTARYDLPRLKVGPAEFCFGFQLSREEGINTGLFTFEMRGNSDHLTAQVRPEYKTMRDDAGNEENTTQTDAVLSWYDREILPESDLRLDLRARKTTDQTSYGGEADYAARNGRIRIQTEKVKQGDVESTRYNGNAFTSFMINNKNVKLGGREQSQSALLIDIEGELTDATFDVLIDGSPRAVAHPNKIVALNLRPYETYTVQLVQRGASFVEFEQQPKQITLYPGNVVSLNWTASELDVVFGRVIDSDGNPIKNALIGGVSGISTTDDYGLFQAELRRDAKIIIVETIESICEIDVPSYSVNQRIGNLGTLACTLRDK